MPQSLTVNFLLYFVSAVVLWLGALRLYVAITPYREFELVRQGNVAAACSLTGVAIGLALPIASLVLHSVSLWDMLVWALIGVIAQLLFWLGIRTVLIRELVADVQADKTSVGLLLGGLSLALGGLNAACLSY